MFDIILRLAETVLDLTETSIIRSLRGISMPGILCNCGNIIRTGEIPNPNEWLFISDVEYDKYSGNIDAEDLYIEMKRFLVCNKCKRIWIYWEGSQKDPVSYLPDNNVEGF